MKHVQAHQVNAQVCFFSTDNRLMGRLREKLHVAVSDFFRGAKNLALDGGRGSFLFDDNGLLAEARPHEHCFGIRQRLTFSCWIFRRDNRRIFISDLSTFRHCSRMSLMSAFAFSIFPRRSYHNRPAGHKSLF